MSAKKQNEKSGVCLTRRELLAGGMGASAIAILGCGGSKNTPPDAGGAVWVDPGQPEMASDLWQTMAAYVRATPGGLGTRINLYNPATVSQRVVIQVFTLDGSLVVKDELFAALAGGRSHHIELGEYLLSKGVELPFEGSVWIGTTPDNGGPVFMGLQGIGFDWYGAGYIASVHGMRDFGNSGADFAVDTMWSDLILPKVTVGERFVTNIAILNASGDGISEALNATPEIIIRDDAGGVLVSKVLDALPPYASTLVDLGTLLAGSMLETGTIQIREESVGLVAVGFIIDNDNGGIVNADHLFDRHFVTHFSGFG